ncbi:MAG: DeoR/GlpR family DNA-binding transcription regulator [Lachnospiraceae bacterium]|nr:DeoR/GlpR family DNA-binding transcription regulator [Lachnospiraceae bacterium]MCD7841644.1 DeoR/GlpR family DNA-binding transcription regulator [Lachnospiraceae bacterium]
MKTSRSIVNNRREKILDCVRQNGDVSVQELSEQFSVSLLTIRRDLQYLEDHKLLERFYGGARSSADGLKTENPESLKQFRLERIAKFAAGLVKDGDSIFINTSSTALAMVKYITGRNVKIITNNGNIINEEIPQTATVVLLGGELRYAKGSMVGDFTINNLTQVTARKCFIGCGGLCPERGMTTEALNEVRLNQMMFERTNEEVYVLADSSKLGKRSSFVSCPPQVIGNIITDREAPAELVEAFREKGTEVYLVD